MAKRTRQKASKGWLVVVILLIVLALFLLHRTQQAGAFHAQPMHSRPR